MIYLFYGTDTEKTRGKVLAWIEASRAKAPDAPYFRLGADTLSEASLEEVAGSRGLFFSKSLVFIDNPFSRKSTGELVLEHLDKLAASENPVAILLSDTHPAHVKKFEAKATKVFAHDAPKRAERGFNSPLVNALGNGDGPALWKEVVRALRQGDAPEAVHGLLHWKARDLLQKGRPEGRHLSMALIGLLARSREEARDLGSELERFALSLPVPGRS